MFFLTPSALAFSVCLLAASTPATPGGYDELVRFFRDWRAYQKPKLVDGVPDYGAAAMAAQARELETYRQRLAAIDPSAWPIPQQVDYYMVRAELAGLDFDHRVLKPWANNPAFYATVFDEESDQPAREGPFALGAVELWQYPTPLSAKDAATIGTGLRTIPRLLAQARTNLTGNGHDLWLYGARAMRQQAGVLAALQKSLGTSAPGLSADVEKARRATEDFAAWVESRLPEKTGPSGVGIENYDWYLKHVQLVPYTWSELVVLMERELARSRALLAMDEIKHAGLPEPAPVASAEEYDARFNVAVTEYMAFLRDREILTVTDDLDPALRARIGHFRPGPREFFSEIDYRDPEIMRTHGYHWFDKANLAHRPNPSPIRREVLLYNIFNTRTEGHATGWEELMMQAGMFDARPRSSELVYILVAERAARALGELFMQANLMSLEEAAAFACANTPRGWLRMDGQLVRGEQHLYLQQPGYGPSYLVGKIEIEKLLAERKAELGDKFRMKAFMDEFTAAGIVPASLLRWELTGKKPDEVKRMLEGP
ncbi:MAG TPA: DUF885 family protein [Thermoanaerobaculia bacterium]|nr:DUF885 family protein [Thermoanaerobaculia bacterium]